MGNFDRIAILTDLDGTFLGTQRGMARNIEAVEHFKAEGGLFSLSTGRMHFGINKLVRNVNTLVNAPAILCNGTYLYDFHNQRVVSEIFMDGEAAYSVLLFVAEHFPTVYGRVSFRNGYLIDSDNVVSYNLLRGYGIEEITVKPFGTWTTNDWYKLVFEGEKQQLCELRAAIGERYPNVFELNNSSDHLLELQMKGVNKAFMLGAFRDYCREIGKPRKIYVCGDFENDYEILKAADVAVCPLNASDSIKEICDYCFCSHDEGVIADLIEHLEKDIGE